MKRTCQYMTRSDGLLLRLVANIVGFGCDHVDELSAALQQQLSCVQTYSIETFTTILKIQIHTFDK